MDTPPIAWSASLLVTRCQLNRSPSLVSAMVSLLCDDDACQLTVIGPRGRESVVPLSRDTAQRLDAALTDAGG